MSFNIGDPGISRLYSRTIRRVLEGELSKKFFLTRWLRDQGLKGEREAVIILKWMGLGVAE
jgi:hypothetical protein